jgi:UDP-N-acetylmuramoyl-L-alanyl-D-glutamate--2,6-diaminopimelate ligase
MNMASGVESLRPEHPRTRLLSELEERLDVISDSDVPSESIRISGVSGASSETLPGDVFFALPGAKTHGATHALDALARGAVAVVTDDAGVRMLSEISVPVLGVDDPRALLGSTSSWIYGTDQDAPEIFGVTGTNGKTTVVYLLAALLEQMRITTGLSSTAERKIAGRVFSSGLTTPESNHVHALLALMKESSVGAVALEVSAHALSRHRVDGVVFDVVGFTNFSHDHLDDYASLEDYFAAKAELFSPIRAKRGVIIIDSEWGQRLADVSRIPVTTIGFEGQPVEWSVGVTSRSPSSTGFTLRARDGRSLSTSVPMVGDFSALNAALAIVMLLEAGHDFEAITGALSRHHGFNALVPGRTEIVSGAHGPLVYVDYGHTPDAFEHTLAAIRSVVSGKVIMVFGADGDRDTTKREAMGAIAAQGSDVVIITDFHPRTEDPNAIRATLLAGARGAGTSADIRECADPYAAVRLAISLAHEGDAILYAGPGHEDYRDVGTERIPYSARDDMRLALTEAGWKL